MSDSTPRPEVVIERAVRRILGGVHTITIGYIEAYDAARGEADVQPAVMAPFRNELGVRVPYNRAVIPHVPVYFPGGGGTRDTWPIARGDACIVLHCSHPIAKWSVQGGIVDEQNDTQRHNLSNAIALVGISDFGHFQPAHATARVLEAAELRLGGQDATEAALKGDAFMTALDTFVTSLASAIAGIPTGGAAAAAAITTAKGVLDAAAATFKSTIVKVK